MQKNEVLEIVNRIKYLPNSPITNKQILDEIVETFFLLLEDLPADMVKAATVQYLSEGNPFFPSNPGVLRDKAMDLQMLAMGIPSPAEAWGMVLTSTEYIPPVFCEIGAPLRDATMTSASNYWQAIKAYDAHMETCTICNLGGFRENYKHSAVAETVKLLGGRDVILTDNPVADRARFIEAYKEIVAREKKVMGMTPVVARFVEDNRPLLDDKRAAFDTGEKRLLEKWSVK